MKIKKRLNSLLLLSLLFIGMITIAKTAFGQEPHSETVQQVDTTQYKDVDGWITQKDLPFAYRWAESWEMTDGSFSIEVTDLVNIDRISFFSHDLTVSDVSDVRSTSMFYFHAKSFKNDYNKEWILLLIGSDRKEYYLWIDRKEDTFMLTGSF